MILSELLNVLQEKLTAYGDVPVTVAELSENSELVVYDLEPGDINVQDGELIISLWQTK